MPATKSKKPAVAKGRREGFATVMEVAQYLKVSKHMIYRLINEKKLPATVIGQTRRILWDDIYALHRTAG